MKTDDNYKLHATFYRQGVTVEPKREDGEACGCVLQGGVYIKYCDQHKKPAQGEASPLGRRGATTLNHSKKTGSVAARRDRRLRQLAREKLPPDHKKKRGG